MDINDDHETVANVPLKMALGENATIEIEDLTSRVVLTQGDQRVVFESPGPVVYLLHWLEDFAEALHAHGKKQKPRKAN